MNKENRPVKDPITKMGIELVIKGMLEDGTITEEELMSYVKSERK